MKLNLSHIQRTVKLSCVQTNLRPKFQAKQYNTNILLCTEGTTALLLGNNLFYATSG